MLACAHQILVCDWHSCGEQYFARGCQVFVAAGHFFKTEFLYFAQQLCFLNSWAARIFHGPFLCTLWATNGLQAATKHKALEGETKMTSIWISLLGCMLKICRNWQPLGRNIQNSNEKSVYVCFPNRLELIHVTDIYSTLVFFCWY